MSDFYTWVILLNNQSEEIGEKQLSLFGSSADQISLLMFVALTLQKLTSRSSPCSIVTVTSKISLNSYLLTLKAPITTKVVCFSRLLKYLRSLYGKQCKPRSDCSYRSCLFWVHAVCFYTYFVSNARQLFAADDFSRRHFQMHFFSWRFKG